MILDLFAGPGGWEEGLRLLGVTEPSTGVEWDRDAVATARAAGHARVLADVREVDTGVFHNVSGLIASPPCQSFSDAGKSHTTMVDGRRVTVRSHGSNALPRLVQALTAVAEGATCAQAATAAGLDAENPKTVLVLEPMRFIRDLRPGWVACENVRAVRKVWAAYADLLPALGYSTWSGILNAADYGVPQKRLRSFLLATRHGLAGPPPPTHADPGREAGLLALPPWVTFAQACDLGPRPDDATAWAWDRPATTVVRSYCADVIAAPGYRKVGDPPRQKTPGSITVTPEQMMVLQGLRTDYPITASARTKRLSLIGAVLPPPWAAAILGSLIAQQRTAQRVGA